MAASFGTNSAPTLPNACPSLRASEMAGVSVPAAVSGPRTAYHVLSVRSEFPASLKGDKRLAGRFRRHVESMRQEGLIQTGTIKTPARRYIDILKCANA